MMLAARFRTTALDRENRLPFPRGWQWVRRRRTAAIPNPIERDVQLKRVLGFGEASFIRLAELLRVPVRATARA